MTSRRAALTVGTLASVRLGHWPAVAAPALSPSVPLMGLGSCCDDFDTSFAMVLEGLRAGYRLIDTAAHYDSEAAVGAALVEARQRGILLQTEEVRVVTKIWFDDMGYEPALASARRSMDNLQTERLDTLLIHFPGSVDAVQDPKRNRKLREQTWRACETLLADGRAKRIGLSNWTPRHLRTTLAECREVPSVLQAELHPRLQQNELVECAREAGIGIIMAHCPLAHGSRALLKEPTLAQLAAAAGALRRCSACGGA